MNITVPNLGWVILAFLLAGEVLATLQCWFDGQYEVARHGFSVRATRRWYGTHAHVCLRGDEDNDKAERYNVLRWDDESTTVPWLLVENLDDGKFGAAPYWAPVTAFAPYTVRRLRPHVLRTERYRFPMLFDYLPPRRPAGYLQDGA